MAVIHVPVDVDIRQRLNRLAVRPMPAVDDDVIGPFRVVDQVTDNQVLFDSGDQFAWIFASFFALLFDGLIMLDEYRDALIGVYDRAVSHGFQFHGGLGIDGINHAARRDRCRTDRRVPS